MDAFLQFAEMMKGQNRIFGREEVHCEDRMEDLNTEIEKLEKDIKILKSNQMVFPEPIIRAKRLIQGERRTRRDGCIRQFIRNHDIYSVNFPLLHSGAYYPRKKADSGGT